MSTTITTSSIIAQAEKCRKAYFWRPRGGSSGRRASEQQNSFIAEAIFDDVAYVAECDWQESCSHIYAKMYYKKDGKTVTLRSIKRLPADLIWNITGGDV